MNLSERDLLAQTIFDIWTSSPHLDLFAKAQKAATVCLVMREEGIREVRRLSMVAARRKDEANGVLARALAESVLRLSHYSEADVDDVLARIAPMEVIER